VAIKTHGGCGRTGSSRKHGVRRGRGGLRRAEGRAWRMLVTGIAKATALGRWRRSDAAMQLEAPSSVWGGAGWAAGLMNLRKAAGRVQVPCSLTMPDLSSGG